MVKCTLGVWKWPRLQPCKLMKDELRLSVPDRQRGPSYPPEVGNTTVRGHTDKKQLFSKHKYPPTRNLPIPKVTLF